MADRVHTLTEDALREVQRQYWEQQRELANLKNALTHTHRVLARHEVYDSGVAQIAVHNASGEIIPANGVMRVTEVGEDDDVHEVAKPNDTFKCRYLVNLDSAIAIDGTGYGTWLEQSGKVLYDTGTPAIDEEWGAKSGQWTLNKNRPGFLITGGVNATDTVVRAKQHLVTDLKGKAGSGISKGSSGDVVIWMGASGAEAPTEYTISCSALGAAITSAKYVVVWFESGVWYVAPWECA